MGLIFLTFLIGTLNLAVGFAVAMRLGYGPPSLTAAWAGCCRCGTAQDEDDDDDFEAMLSDIVDAGAEEMLEDIDEMESDLEPSADLYDDEASALMAPDAPEVWDINEQFVETSILRLNIAMMKSGARATEIDTRLRAIRGQSDVDTIRDCCEKLKQDCETYLKEQSEAAEKFSARIGELGELADLGEEIEFANMNQASQIETTLSNLAYMDFDSDLESANGRLLEEIANLRMARHQLRDDQETAFLTIARYEDRLEKIEEKLFHDALTGVRNRIGLEVALHEWWLRKQHQSRPISAALFDLDDFGPRNEEHGCLVGDRMLYQIAQVLSAQIGQADMLARYGGQRFILFVADSGPRAAIKTAENIRQTIARTVFVHGETRFGITTSGAVTEVTAEDESYLDVVGRLNKAIDAAKDAGRNCLFGCQRNELDAKPERIEAPDFGIQDQEIEI